MESSVTMASLNRLTARLRQHGLISRPLPALTALLFTKQRSVHLTSQLSIEPKPLANKPFPEDTLRTKVSTPCAHQPRVHACTLWLAGTFLPAKAASLQWTTVKFRYLILYMSVLQIDGILALATTEEERRKTERDLFR
jgi:hypothetical protein